MADQGFLAGEPSPGPSEPVGLVCSVRVSASQQCGRSLLLMPGLPVPATPAVPSSCALCWHLPGGHFGADGTHCALMVVSVCFCSFHFTVSSVKCFLCFDPSGWAHVRRQSSCPCQKQRGSRLCSLHSFFEGAFLELLQCARHYLGVVSGLRQ